MSSYAKTISHFYSPPSSKKNSNNSGSNRPPEGWDVLIMAGNNFRPYDPFSDYAIRVHFCATTNGYIVAQHYYDTLLDNPWQFLTISGKAKDNSNSIRNKKNSYAIDVGWRKLQQTKDSHWYMLIPPTVTQIQSYSDIERREVNYSRWILDYDKRQWV